MYEEEEMCCGERVCDTHSAVMKEREKTKKQAIYKMCHVFQSVLLAHRVVCRCVCTDVYYMYGGVDK